MPDFTFRFVYAHFHRLSPFRCIYSILYEVEMFTQLMPQSCNSHNSLSGPRTALSLTRSLVTKLSSVQLPFITWSDRPCWMLDGHSSSLSSLDTNRLHTITRGGTLFLRGRGRFRARVVNPIIRDSLRSRTSFL